MTLQIIKHDQLNTSVAHRVRHSIDDDIIDQYAEAMRGGAEFPPATVFWDGTTYWMGDGIHRYHGTLKAGIEGLLCDVSDGGEDDALRFALSANTKHGKRRSHYDTRQAVFTALERYTGVMKDYEIAKLCGVTKSYISMARHGQIPKATSPQEEHADKLQKVAVQKDYTLPGDGSGVPPKVLAVLASTHLQEALVLCDRLKDLIRKCGEDKLYGRWFDPFKQLGKVDSIRKTLATVDAAMKDLSAVEIKETCATCAGDGCEACRGTGWIPKGV